MSREGLMRILGVVLLCLMVAVSPNSACHSSLRSGARTAAVALAGGGDEEDDLP